MMKEIKPEDNNPLAELKNNFWKAMNLFRGFIDVKDYSFILYLLLLNRNGIFKDFIFSDEYDLKQQFESKLQNLNGETGEFLKDIYRLYPNTLKHLNPGLLHELFKFITSIDQNVLENHFGEIFDDLLFMLSKWQGRFAGEFMLPLELSRFVCGLAELPPNAKVYNPFSGAASFGTCLDNDKFYIGQESNFSLWAIGKMRIIAHDRERNSKLFFSDSIHDWNPTKKVESSKPEDILLYTSTKDKFDLIISNPPFGVRISSPINGQFGSIRNFEQFLIENGLADLKHDGKLIAVLPQRFLFSAGTDKILRQFLVDNDLLEKVISFPSGLLIHTGVSLAVIVLNKNKKEKGVVRFIDAKQCVEITSARERHLNDKLLSNIVKSSLESESLRIISNSTISSFEYNLDVPRYFLKNTME
ncbi:MAG: N-6 DNA methylase [Bacteroidetes bacterium]|nr:N-6 DNA methylase [Bacteroidota bacterium]